MVERSFQRFPASLPGALMASDGPHVIRSMDLSRNGCRIQNTVPLVPGITISLFLFPPGEDIPIVVQDAMVRWSRAEGIGIQFQPVEFHNPNRLALLIDQLRESH